MSGGRPSIKYIKHQQPLTPLTSVSSSLEILVQQIKVAKTQEAEFKEQVLNLEEQIKETHLKILDLETKLKQKLEEINNLISHNGV